MYQTKANERISNGKRMPYVTLKCNKSNLRDSQTIPSTIHFLFPVLAGISAFRHRRNRLLRVVLSVGACRRRT